MGPDLNVLIVGSGKGSWEMRGLQLGKAIGARVSSDPTQADLEWANLVVLVKRAMLSQGPRVAAFRKPIVWDAIDFWSQPAQNRLDEASAISLLLQHVDKIKPVLVIGATEAMAKACRGVCRGVCLPHHGHLTLRPTAARPECRVVGYEGNAGYLEHWAGELRTACAARGWAFLINPPDLSACDILVSLRGGVWDGWICREWKSGVKISNAILAGRPILTQDCAAARELKPEGSIIETPQDVARELDRWADASARHDVVRRSRERALWFTVESIAARYREILAAVVGFSSPNK